MGLKGGGAFLDELDFSLVTELVLMSARLFFHAKGIIVIPTLVRTIAKSSLIGYWLAYVYINR